MAVTKIKGTSSFTNLTKYDSFLAGNAAYNPSSYESIASATGTGSSGTITFSSIPSTYKSLQLRMSVLCTADNQALYMTVNGITTDSYTNHILNGDGATVTATGSGYTGGAQINIGYSRQAMTTQPKVAIIDIHNYASTTQLKTIRTFTGINRNTSGNDITLQSNLVDTTNAISSISLFFNANNFASGTTISLYGIKGA